MRKRKFFYNESLNILYERAYYKKRKKMEIKGKKLLQCVKVRRVIPK